MRIHIENKALFKENRMTISQIEAATPIFAAPSA